jgi:hypothetical protein
MAEEADRYFDSVKNQDKNQIVSAYVTFRSMEGANRAINITHKGLVSNLLNPSLRFRDSILSFKRAVGPDLIHWENLSVSKITRSLWTLLIYCLSLVCLIGVIIGIMLI